MGKILLLIAVVILFLGGLGESNPVVWGLFFFALSFLLDDVKINVK